MDKISCESILLAEDNANDVLITRRAWKKGQIKNKLFVVNDGEQALEFLYRKGQYAKNYSSREEEDADIHQNAGSLSEKEANKKEGKSKRRAEIDHRVNAISDMEWSIAGMMLNGMARFMCGNS